MKISEILKFVLFICNCIYFNANCQTNKLNLLGKVTVPNKIYLQLEEAYKEESKGHPNGVNAGRNVFNLINRNDFTFKNGIYSFKGQGPHFTRRIFIFNNDSLFIFKNNGLSDPKLILYEFIDCIEKLRLSNHQIRKYLYVVSNYLKDEAGNNYEIESR